MEIFDLTYPHELNKDKLPATVCAIGFFDGVHKGHQEVINKAVSYAEKHDLESAVVTFFPHPSIVLSNGRRSIEYITPPAEKQVALRKLGVDRVYTITFNKQLSQLSPEKFIDHFIIDLNIQHLIAGFDFTYGHKGEGNMENLQEYTKNQLTFTTIPKITQDDEKISSTMIRQSMKEKNIEHINQWLGRPFQTIGTVQEGSKRGRTIGFPTANITVDKNALLPKIGAYAVKITIQDKQYIGMANLGYRPTFEEDDAHPVLEVHILDFSDNIYGKTITVDWYKFIRPEQSFANVDQLVNQLKNDEQQIRNYFQ